MFTSVCVHSRAILYVLNIECSRNFPPVWYHLWSNVHVCLCPLTLYVLPNLLWSNVHVCLCPSRTILYVLIMLRSNVHVISRQYHNMVSSSMIECSRLSVSTHAQFFLNTLMPWPWTINWSARICRRLVSQSVRWQPLIKSRRYHFISSRREQTLSNWRERITEKERIAYTREGRDGIGQLLLL